MQANLIVLRKRGKERKSEENKKERKNHALSKSLDMRTRGNWKQNFDVAQYVLFKDWQMAFFWGNSERVGEIYEGEKEKTCERERVCARA